jgi:Rieske Fe-S protein
MNRRRFLRWAWRVPVLAAIVGGAIGVLRVLRVHLGKTEPVADPEFRAVATVPIAPIGHFDERWSSAEFVVNGTPAIAVRIPADGGRGSDSGVASVAGFSRVCTHQGCIVDLYRSPEAIALASNYRGSVPALVCPCHLSVFLPTENGRAVSGPAVLPLPRVRIEAVGGNVVATGIEVLSGSASR